MLGPLARLDPEPDTYWAELWNVADTDEEEEEDEDVGTEVGAVLDS